MADHQHLLSRLRHWRALRVAAHPEEAEAKEPFKEHFWLVVWIVFLGGMSTAIMFEHSKEVDEWLGSYGGSALVGIATSLLFIPLTLWLGRRLDHLSETVLDLTSALGADMHANTCGPS